MKLRVTLTLTLMLLGIFVWQTHTALGQQIVTDGLVAAYTFDAEDGRDSAGSNDCETEGAPRPDPEGVLGGAMEFNGVNDAYNCGDPADGSLDVGTDDYTITCWALPFDTGVSARLMDKKDDSDVGYMLEHNVLSGFQTYVSDGQGDVSRVIEPEGNQHYDDEWHHVAGVHKRDDVVRLYVDGVEILDGNHMLDADAANEQADNGSPFYIARRPSGEYFAGLIDELYLYNKALTLDEVLQNFNATEGPGVGSAVEAGAKLAITWGKVKASR